MHGLCKSDLPMYLSLVPDMVVMIALVVEVAMVVRVVIVVKTGMYGLVMVMCHGLSQGDHVSQDSDDGDGLQLLPPAPL